MSAPTKKEAFCFARQALETGNRSPEVVKQLVEMGYDEIAAFGVVREAIEASPAEPSSKSIGWSDIRTGLVILAIGAGVSLLSLMLTDASGRHRYFVAAGAGLFGTLYVLKGIWRVMRG